MLLNFLMDDEADKPYPFSTLAQVINSLIKNKGHQAMSNFGLLDTYIFPIRYLLSGSRHFTITDKTAQMLAFSYLATNAPSSLFRLPFDTIYIQLSETHVLDMNVYNTETGMHPIEGCYVVERTIDRFPSSKDTLMKKLNYKGNLPVRTYEILSVGGSKDPLNAYDDATHFFKIYIQDDERPIVEIIKIHIEHYQSFRYEFDGSTPMGQEEVDTTNAIMEQLVKSLVYLNSDGVTKREINEVSELRNKLKTVGAKKRSRIERKLEKSYDYTLIGPSGDAINYQKANNSSVLSGRKAH